MGEEMTNIPLSFNVTLYGEMQPYNDSLTKCRVRIFYKGMNRNRTYISEEFANQLIASLPYTPIKGIFNKDDVDFEDHGKDYDDGKIYGIVMANPNFAWEDHIDVDGVTRKYACADVLLYTSLYSEAKIIPNSSQSMEINPYTYTGEWKISEEDGKPYYYFESGSLFGLQVLGMTTEPCFEGAAFYYNLIKEDLAPLIDYVKQISKKQESEKMDISLYKLSDNEKADLIFEALNPNCNAENDWIVSYMVLDVYDDYVVTYETESGKYMRVYYSKNENDGITIGEKVEVKIVDVTLTEATALEAIKIAGNGSYEAANTAYVEANSKVETLTNEVSEKTNQIADFEAKIAEKDQALVDVNAKYETVNADYEALKAEKVGLEKVNADLNSEKESLFAFKTQVETEQKEQILSKYMEHLTDSIIETLKEGMDKYSVQDFKKEVCTAAVENDPTVFSKSAEPERYYKGGELNAEDSKNLSSMERLLQKHKYGGNK